MVFDGRAGHALYTGTAGCGAFGAPLAIMDVIWADRSLQ
ncbi:hypothetical protein SALB1_1413 [Salinisphaera sp. LB1]|nr:hypothetical protein SALB1_1413 [Salinisphaera sp. LB1]